MLAGLDLHDLGIIFFEDSAKWKPGPPFAHAYGLRQGDPLSPMLFIVAIDPLQLTLWAASQARILHPIKAHSASCRISLYADDAGIFANPVKEELDAIAGILACFGEASGLITNVTKTEVFPIRCQVIDLTDCYLLSTALDFPEEERLMQQSSCRGC